LHFGEKQREREIPGAPKILLKRLRIGIDKLFSAWLYRVDCGEFEFLGVSATLLAGHK
jgi:hypothetical protein